MAKIRFAEVRNLKDPWESGRVQLRIYGAHDSEQKVKDDDLPWALPVQDITSAATERIGTSPTGMLVGSRVIVTYAEDDTEEQYPIILGTYARAGKGKGQDNTGGFDEVDDKYGDAPIGQYGSPRMTPKTNTQSKTVAGSQKRDPTKTPKYNESDYVAESDGTDVLKAAKEKFAADLGNLPTVASIDKKAVTDMLGMIQKVDPQNLSAILPQAVTNLQKIIQIGNMTSPGGITNLTGNVLGNVFKSIASNVGLGSLVGQLGGALGIPGIPGGAPGISGIAGVISNVTGASGLSGVVNGLTVVSNAIGGVPIQGILTRNSGASHSTPAQLPLINQVGNISATLLNQLGGHEPPNDYVAQLDDNSKKALYLGLLELLNSTRDDLTVDPPVARRSDGTCIIPAEYIVTVVPDGYLQVFSFSETDPYPGYIKWEGPEAQIVFTVRPADRPYSPTPSEDCINAGVKILKEDLLALVRAGKLDLDKLLALLGITRNKVEETGTENSLGSGINLQNIMQFATKLLGLLGTNITSAISNHISGGSVLEEAAKKAVEGYTKKFAVARAQKPSGKKVVANKQPDTGGIPPSLLSFAASATGWSNPQSGVVPAATVPTPIPNSALNTTPQPGAFIASA